MGRRFAAQMGAPLTAQSIEIATLEIRHHRQNRDIARQRSPRRCRHRTLRCLPGFGFRAAHADHAARFVLGLGSRRPSLASVWTGSSRAAREYVGPTLEFLRPLPASAVIPVAIAMFGLTPRMALGVIGFGSIWPVLLATMHGFAAVEPRLVEVARALRMSRWKTIAKVSLPSATPDILAGLRLGLTVSLILAVVCEMIAGLDGLGQWVLLAARSYKSADIFAGVALLGAIGVTANAALWAVEGRLLGWRGAHGP